MCEGEKRTLTIQPKWAYGDRAMGPILKHAVLIFDTDSEGLERGVTNCRLNSSFPEITQRYQIKAQNASLSHLRRHRHRAATRGIAPRESAN